MDVGVLTVVLGDSSLGKTLEYVSDLGITAVEFGVGGFPGDAHLQRDEYLGDERAQAILANQLDERDLYISALATHNNPLHPDDETATQADTELREAITLAHQLDVPTITCFSGLPAGGPDDTVPNWLTAPWPTEHADAHEYQWDVAIDYWSELAAYAADHDVTVAIEMHPNMLVYEPHGLLRLRAETNEYLGANFDPSHLYWQRIEPTEAIRFLGSQDAIHHVHAKDTKVYETNARTKGVLDMVPYANELDRSWLFRSVGYGHGESHWKDIVSTLRMIGYDGALSIEHEDSLTSGREGLEKAADVLSRAIFETTPTDAYWAA